MEAAELRKLCEKMSSQDIVTALEGSVSVIGSVSDQEMRTEYTNLVTTYQSAEDSKTMHTAFEAIINHVKKQYAMIYLQGFAMGKSFQQELFKEAIDEARRAQQGGESKEKSEDSE